MPHGPGIHPGAWPPSTRRLDGYIARMLDGTDRDRFQATCDAAAEAWDLAIFFLARAQRMVQAASDAENRRRYRVKPGERPLVEQVTLAAAQAASEAADRAVREAWERERKKARKR